jgi:hypothetical protein
MIAIRGLAVAATLGVAAIAFAPRGAADPSRETFAVTFRYDAERSALDNYLAFARQAETACSAADMNTRGVRRIDRACVEGLLDEVVSGMTRTQLADLHAAKTGRRADSSRTLAAR